MEGIDPYILFGGIGAIALIVAGLFYKGKIRSFIFEKDDKKLKVEVKAPENQVLPTTPPAAIPARDTIENKGNLQVHNYGLDENAIRKMFEEQEKKFEKLLESGSESEEESDLLKLQLAAVETKLANMEKALEDRENRVGGNSGGIRKCRVKKRRF